MADLLKGVPAAKALTETLRARAEGLKTREISPCLAIVRVGAREDDLSYERGAMKRCDKVGISVRRIVLPETVSQESMLTEIGKLNRDKDIHGVLLFRPLPKTLDDRAICEELLPEKDVDGITSGSLAAVYAGTKQGYPPCTAAACVELLKHYQIPVSGKRAMIIGRSLVIGRPVSMLLMAENATVTICHSRTQNLSEICREADIIVAAAGKAGMIGKDFLRPGQVVLDIGIHVNTDGSLCGDVRFDEAEPIVKAITPVPGGVGAVTTAILAEHVLTAAEISAGK